MYYLGCLSSCTQIYGPQILKYYLALYRKFAASVIEEIVIF